jgi:zinc transporter ZupT
MGDILTFTYVYIKGMLSSSGHVSVIISGYANALTAGILLHAAMIEMLSEDFFNPVFDNRPLAKLSMYVGLVFGFSVMALLAVWG